MKAFLTLQPNAVFLGDNIVGVAIVNNTGIK